jgi:hypothetical protein
MHSLTKKRISVFLIFFISVAIIISAVFGVIYMPIRSEGSAYTIPLIDLSVMPENTPEELQYLFNMVTVDDSKDYLAHPDSILLAGGDILTMYPEGHGKGAIQTKLTHNSGVSYPDTLSDTPVSWMDSRETPTLYRLEFTDPEQSDKLIMISANPKWPMESTEGGFNCSISEDEGITWSEFQLFYPKSDSNGVVPIVAMASLTRLKENGEFVDKWMGFFHDSSFYNYKTILSFDQSGRMQWSVPEKYFSEYRNIERRTQMCEVEVIRSDMGQGDELCLITRSNTKKVNSLISFSSDEGNTWSEPREVPSALSGERHKAEYTSDGRLVITFRSIMRDDKINSIDNNYKRNGWYSEGPVAWVGTYEDLKEGREGQYRIKLAHTYFDGQLIPETAANGDTGYCGNVVSRDNTVVMILNPERKAAHSEHSLYPRGFLSRI